MIFHQEINPIAWKSFPYNFSFLGTGRITCNQESYLFGLDNTSPTFASAIENSIPAITFLMAAVLRQAIICIYIYHSFYKV